MADYLRSHRRIIYVLAKHGMKQRNGSGGKQQRVARRMARNGVATA
jgi:hypothetical protein